jgi:hypothetical protein
VKDAYGYNNIHVFRRKRILKDPDAQEKINLNYESRNRGPFLVEENDVCTLHCISVKNYCHHSTLKHYIEN